MAQFQWSGLGRLQALLARVANPDANPLMERWEKIIFEDNRRGVLAGQDRYGRPMPAVTYRPIASAPKRRVPRRAGAFGGIGPYASGLHNNLSPAEYRRLNGPPLAPRGGNSRVITNLGTGHDTAPVGGVWTAEGRWFDVVSPRGVPFLMAHFTGARVGRGHAVKLPVRDLRGVRPWGIDQAVKATREWAISLLQG